MRALVTGAAGFIGSHLVEALLGTGWDVTGLDCFTDYYDPAVKWANLASALAHPGFTLVEADLCHADLAGVLAGAGVVFHLAGQPGVRPSWGDGFSGYVAHNVIATQRLLEAARRSGPSRVVYASSSSVYGNAVRYPTTEAELPHPHSPYGVTKLAGENLCSLYAANWGLPTVSLRYFTVYGPRQRPDMAIGRLVKAVATGEPFPLFGQGDHVRDFTYVGDVVRANLLAAAADVPPGTYINIAGGSSVTMNELIALAEEVGGGPAQVQRHPVQPGDAKQTGGSTDRARRLLGWVPEVSLRAGLESQFSWYRDRAPVLGPH